MSDKHSSDYHYCYSVQIVTDEDMGLREEVGLQR